MHQKKFVERAIQVWHTSETIHIIFLMCYLDSNTVLIESFVSRKRTKTETNGHVRRSRSHIMQFVLKNKNEIPLVAAQTVTHCCYGVIEACYPESVSSSVFKWHVFDLIGPREACKALGIWQFVAIQCQDLRKPSSHSPAKTQPTT